MDTKQNQQQDAMHRAKSEGNQVQTSMSSVSGVTKDVFNPSSTEL